MRTKQGLITSAKMQRTVTVTVHRLVFHALYKKRFRRSKKFLADSGDFTDLHEGDMVVITECRPLSKRKCFRVTEVIKRAPHVSEIAEDKAVAGVMRLRKKPSTTSDASVSPDSSTK